MSETKYRILEDKKVVTGLGDKIPIILHRIQATQSFRTLNGEVKAGDLGGWIEYECNLDQSIEEGPSAWVSDEACVCGYTYVKESAMVYDNAFVGHGGLITNCAEVFENAFIGGTGGDIVIKDNAAVFGRTRISSNGRVEIKDCSRVYGTVDITRGDVVIEGHAKIHGTTLISGDVTVGGNANIRGYTMFNHNDVRIGGNVTIKGNCVSIPANAIIIGDTTITRSSDILTIGPFGPNEDYLTFYRGNQGTLMVAGLGNDENSCSVIREWPANSLLGKESYTATIPYCCVGLEPGVLRSAINFARIKLPY